jgi:Tfp pilus assembly protein FimT
MSPHKSSAPPIMPSTVAIPLLAAVMNKGHSETGVSLQEKKSSWGDVAVAGGIIALLLALLIPTLGRQELTLRNAKHNLMEHLRFTRAGAMNRGAHFRVTFQTNAYAIEQLQDKDGDGVWTTDAALPSWRINLPTTVTIEAGAAQVVEFDNNGSLTGSKNTQDEKITIRVRDVQNGRTEIIHLLPSGQVQEA